MSMYTVNYLSRQFDHDHLCVGDTKETHYTKLQAQAKNLENILVYSQCEIERILGVKFIHA